MSRTQKMEEVNLEIAKAKLEILKAQARQAKAEAQKAEMERDILDSHIRYRESSGITHP